MNQYALNGLWKHHSGNIYTVLGVSNLDADENRQKKFTMKVFYMDTSGLLWDRPLKEFKDKFSKVV